MTLDIFFETSPGTYYHKFYFYLFVLFIPNHKALFHQTQPFSSILKNQKYFREKIQNETESNRHRKLTLNCYRIRKFHTANAILTHSSHLLHQYNRSSSLFRGNTSCCIVVFNVNKSIQNTELQNNSSVNNFIDAQVDEENNLFLFVKPMRT
ncbi:unnamed protein product [Rotaria magnacalcarata]